MRPTSLPWDVPPISADVLAAALGVADTPAPLQEPSPPFNHACACSGCEREAVAVSLTTRMAYCAVHGSTLAAAGLSRLATFPVCSVRRCGRLAVARLLVARRDERERWVTACARHGEVLCRRLPVRLTEALYDDGEPAAA